MISQRILLLGMFLTPFTRLLPVSGFGMSVGDICLIGGAMGVLARRRLARTPCRRSFLWSATFVVPGSLIVLATMLSTLANQSASTLSMFTLATQYFVTLVLVPLALSQQSLPEITAAATWFVYGLGLSIILGMTIITLFAGLEETLSSRGWMFAVAGDRHGLFAGVGELAKMASMGGALVYYLAMRGRIGLGRAGILLGAVVVALIVTRSGTGVATAAAVASTVALVHLGVRHRIRTQSVGTPGGKGLLVGLIGVVSGALTLRRLDGMGSDYREAFVARVTQPLANEGVEGVGSASIRGQLVDEAWTIIDQNPIFGTGPGLYHQASDYGAGVHVVPLMLWAETGILALTAWLVLVLALVLVIAAAMRHAPIAGVAAVGVLAGLLVTHMSAPYMYGRGLLLPMVLALYLMAAGREPLALQIALSDESKTGLTISPAAHDPRSARMD